MASIEELKQRIDLHDLALKLGMDRPGGNDGNYRSPHHPDKSPSLSIFSNGKRWKDHSSDEGGTCVDLVMYVDGVDSVSEAIKKLHEIYQIPFDKPQQQGQRKDKSRAEFIADRCFGDTTQAVAYLKGRGIDEAVITRAIGCRSVGFNDWRSDQKEPGTPGYGGPCVAFIVRSLNPGHVVAVDMRYLDPKLNGGVKTQAQGEKAGFPWFVDAHALARAHTVYLVESPINALSVESCGMKGTVSVAIRGAGNTAAIDWEFLRGKRVVICMDNDAPNERTGLPPGAVAAWKILEQLTAINIAAELVDQGDWEVNDVNDILEAAGPDMLRTDLRVMDSALIPGLPSNLDKMNGRPRVYLPAHDFAQYWRYRTYPDFTTLIKTVKDADGNESEKHTDLCGFRIAGLSRVKIAGSTSVMSGEADTSPITLFAVTVQVPRHGYQLQRRVFEDDRLHNVEQWKKFGTVFMQAPFFRMVSILERAADIGARDAINFVGLAWKKGQLTVNEGPDCYFTDPTKQCPYHNLSFPSGNVFDARRVIGAYQDTFKQNAAAMMLVWSLGGHLKALLGFWPHQILQSNKGSGKSTIIKRLERSIGFTMFSGQSLQTEFRLLTSIGHTSHPVGWEELSARRQDVIDKAVGLLQENYQYTTTRRGSDMTEYLISAPVLLAGEDVPVRSLLGKVVRVDITAKKGPLMPEELPRFPVRQWLEFLTTLTRAQVRETYNKAREYCQVKSRAPETDDGAMRMAGNYAAVLTAWRLLTEFSGIDRDQGGFIDDVIQEMNTHIAETSADREPWVWIVEIILSEISAGNYRHPFKWGLEPNEERMDEECLFIRTSHIMDHLAHTPSLRDRFNALPVKSDRVFKRQLRDSGVLVSDSCERTIHGRRSAHLVAIGLDRLAQYGLHASPPEDIEGAA